MAICLYGSYGNYGNYASCGQTKQTAGLCRFCGIFRMAGETPRCAQCGNRSQPRQPRSIGLAPARCFGGPKAQISPPSDRRPAVWREHLSPRRRHAAGRVDLLVNDLRDFQFLGSCAHPSRFSTTCPALRPAMRAPRPRHRYAAGRVNLLVNDSRHFQFLGSSVLSRPSTLNSRSSTLTHGGRHSAPLRPSCAFGRRLSMSRITPPDSRPLVHAPAMAVA